MALHVTDAEILEIRRIQLSLNHKYAFRSRGEKVIEEIEKDAVEQLANLGWVAHCDAFPILMGEELTITLLHRLDSNFEFDHEQKSYEVREAKERGEKIHGEKDFRE